MLSLLLILLPPLLAWLIFRRWFGELRLLVTAGLALIAPILIVGWVSVLLATQVSPDIGVIAILLILLGILVLELSQSRPARVKASIRQYSHRIRRSLTHGWASWLCLLVLLPLFGYLLLTHSAQVRDGAWYSAGSSWGDLALHLTYITYFVRQETISLVSPVYAQAQTTYPFLFDWYTSIFIRLGWTMQAALIVTQWQAMVAVVLLALAVIQRFDKRSATTLMTMGLFIVGGGLGWWYFWGDWQASGLSLLKFLQEMPWQYTNMSERWVYFSSIIPDMLLPQRGFTVGLAGVLASVALFLQFVSSSKRRYLYIGSLLLGLLPLFHVHSFLWAAGLWVVLSGFHGWQQPKYREALIKAFTLVSILAIPQIWWFTAHGVGSHFITWKPGWMLVEAAEISPTELIRLFFLNFGLIAVVLLYLPTQFRRIFQKNRQRALILGYGWLVFTVCLLLSFQPWAYDNLKLMMPSFFFLCLFAAGKLADWWQGRGKIVVLLILFIGMTSGGLSVFREFFLSDEIASARDLALAADLQKMLKPGAVTLTADNHNHPVPMLVGQPIVLGYGGWLWSHGVDSSTTTNNVIEMFAGSANADDLLQKYGIRYVYISDRERAKFAVNERYWSEHFQRIYHNGNVSVYEISN